MKKRRNGRPIRILPALTALVFVAAISAPKAKAAAPAPAAATCKEVVLNGTVSAGKEWKAAFGEGWVFRVLPIHMDKANAGVSGWDLVVDRKKPAGYPDALLLATPPYNFINDREIGTTFGLRAQDAIGWNPRNFRFMTNPADFREAQKLFLELGREGALGPRPKNPKKAQEENEPGGKMQQLQKLVKESSSGEFRIIDARIAPGVGRVRPYAQNWARQSEATPHIDVPASNSDLTNRGKLEWMRFSITLWLPKGWRTPRHLPGTEAPCPK